ncbi:helix-turn-helix domain-containing protein [Anaerotruncus rubiinfantis]|uniref:helix-turn-helix domain-containing protein n=1 Tax=Anaerotruncus rubiinfantis TaxID=1720200 RepID=UPI0034A36EDB
MVDFGRKLRLLRESRNLTQQELADRLDIGRPTIAHYEGSALYPSVEVLIKLARFFDVSADYLLGLSDDAVPNYSKLTDAQVSLIAEHIRQFEILNAQLKNKYED